VNAFRCHVWRRSRKVEGPNTIKRDWYQRRITIEANVRGRDLGSFVAEAQRVIDEKVKLPPGRYRIEWGGQFENLERAQTRLMIVVPVALLMILALLYMTYRNWIDSLRVFTGVPFAWIGGVLALWIRDMPFSISAAVGFIALSGVAVLDDMLLVSTIRQLRERGRSLDDAVEEAESGDDSAATNPDDNTRRQSWLRADGVQHRNGRGGSTALGNSRDRWRL
jgi:cobalt-zinc-cadmium resistance protein CzcA